MDVINYKGGKALLIDSDDLKAMDSPRSRVVKLQTRKIVEAISTMRHEGINTLLILTSFPLSRVPIFLRQVLLGENYGIPMTVVNCYRTVIGGEI